MNKSCYRIVFNARRGQLMAVAETALTSQGASSPGQTRARRPGDASVRTAPGWALKTLAGAVFFGLGLPLHAQIIADPSAPATQRPTVLSDGSGRPLINIQTPSGAGVSRNTYSQFDVQSNGVILNNSRASNPWLATGEARVILNEVNSSNPSHLRGQVAVNGSSAQVVIANPSGLKIDGASFVNASRVTLSTGTAVMDAGALKALRIERGEVEVTGAGLDVQGVPYTEILARTASLNARITGHASGDLNITTGPQTIDYATGQITAEAAATPAPALAIDASALGGMYAGRITLLATEAGVGVRNAGALEAAAQLVLTADGQLTNAGSLRAPVVSLGTVAGDIVQSGQLQASSAALLSAGAGAKLSGQGMVQSAGSAVVVNARKSIELSGSVSSTATGGRVTLGAQEAVQIVSGSTVAGQAGVLISADTQVQVSGATLISSGGSVAALAGSSISLTGSTVTASAIQLETGKALADTSAPISLTNSRLSASNALTVLATGALSTSGNVLSAGTHLHLGSAGAMSLQGDNLRAGSIELIGSGLSAGSLDGAASSGSLKISSSAGALGLSGTSTQASVLAAATELQITALGGDARLSAVQASADDIKVNATGNTQLGSVASTGFWGKNTREVRTALSARKNLTVASVGAGKSVELGKSSLQAASEDVSLVSAGALSLGTATVQSGQGSVSATSAGAITGLGSGSLRAGQNLSIDAGQGDFIISPWQASNLSFGQDLSLTARSGLLKLDGWGGWSIGGANRVAWSGRDISLKGAAVDIVGASLRASRDLKITATEGAVNFLTLTNSVFQSGYLNSYAQGAELSAARNLEVSSAGSISGQGLSASAGGDLKINALARLDLAGSANQLTRFDGFWTTQQRQVNTGQLSAGGAMHLSAGTDLLMDAIKASAGGQLKVNALGDIGLGASQNWTEHTGTTVRSGKTSTTVTHHLRESFTTAPTELSGAGVTVSAGNTLSTYGTRISSGGRAELQAGGAANYYAVWDQVNNRDDSHKTRSFLGIRYSSSSSSSSRVENTPLVTRMQSEADLVSSSGGDTLLQGTQVRANGGYAINAGVGDKARADARIILEGVKTTVQESKRAKSDYVVWQSMSGSGSTTETLALPSFAGGGTFTAPGGLSVQIPEGNFKSQIQTLSQQPGMGYLNDLAARTDVNWQAVKLANDQWNYSQSGLTPAGAALIGLAVAMATGGAGASLLGTTTTTVTTVGGVATSTAITTLGSTTLAVNGVATVAGAMANAAFTSLAAQASITLINNKGDVGKTLKELGNSHTVKNMIIAAGVAGVTTYTADWGRTVLTDTGNTVLSDWAKRSQAYMLNTAAKGVLTGANSSSDWWTVAGLGLAGEAYQYWAGRGADVRPGVDRGDPVVGKLDEQSGLFRMPRVLVNGILREGKNLGHNQPCFSIVSVCHGTPISNALNTVPGLNAFATLHDGWGEWMAQGKNWNLATNLGSMPPALIVNYGALLDQYRYLNSARR